MKNDDGAGGGGGILSFLMLFAVLVVVEGLFLQADIMPWATLYDGGLSSMFVQGL